MCACATPCGTMKLLLLVFFLLQMKESFQRYSSYARFTNEDCHGENLEALIQNFQTFSNTCANASLSTCCSAGRLIGSTNGVYSMQNTDVNCDVNGGWMTFMKRSSNSSTDEFNRSWHHYTRKEGFGDIYNDHWKGLDLLHELTKSYRMELLIELHNSQISQTVSYNYFHVGGPSTDYQLTLGSFKGDESLRGFDAHNNSRFSTHDHDQNYDNLKCAWYYRGGWWYTECYSFLPTAIGTAVKGPGFSHFDSVEMKIRPLECLA